MCSSHHGRHDHDDARDYVPLHDRDDAHHGHGDDVHARPPHGRGDDDAHARPHHGRGDDAHARPHPHHDHGSHMCSPHHGHASSAPANTPIIAETAIVVTSNIATFFFIFFLLSMKTSFYVFYPFTDPTITPFTKCFCRMDILQ